MGWGCTCRPASSSSQLSSPRTSARLSRKGLKMMNVMFLWGKQLCYGLLFNFDGTLIKCLTPGSQVLDDDIHIKKRFDKLSLTWFSVDIFCFQVSRLHNWDNFYIIALLPTINKQFRTNFFKIGCWIAEIIFWKLATCVRIDCFF